MKVTSDPLESTSKMLNTKQPDSLSYIYFLISFVFCRSSFPLFMRHFYKKTFRIVVNLALMENIKSIIFWINIIIFNITWIFLFYVIDFFSKRARTLVACCPDGKSENVAKSISRNFYISMIDSWIQLKFEITRVNIIKIYIISLLSICCSGWLLAAEMHLLLVYNTHYFLTNELISLSVSNCQHRIT